MKTKQINFYFTPQDISEFEKYILANWEIIPNFLPTNKIETQKHFENLCYFVLPQHKDKVQLKYISAKTLYKVDMNISPVIEFVNSHLDESTNVLRRGRIFFAQEFLLHHSFLSFPNDFVENAKKLFRWVQKHFKDVKLTNYEGLLVSENALKWQQQTSGTLLLNNFTPKTKIL